QRILASFLHDALPIYEQVFRGSLETVAAALGTSIPLLGEFVLVIEGRAAGGDASALDVKRVFDVLRRELPPGRAAALTAELTGVSRNEVYKLAKFDDERS